MRRTDTYLFVPTNFFDHLSAFLPPPLLLLLCHHRLLAASSRTVLNLTFALCALARRR